MKLILHLKIEKLLQLLPFFFESLVCCAPSDILPKFCHLENVTLSMISCLEQILSDDLLKYTKTHTSTKKTEQLVHSCYKYFVTLECLVLSPRARFPSEVSFPRLLVSGCKSNPLKLNREDKKNMIAMHACWILPAILPSAQSRVAQLSFLSAAAASYLMTYLETLTFLPVLMLMLRVHLLLKPWKTFVPVEHWFCN